jgi:hypothetical protein
MSGDESVARDMLLGHAEVGRPRRHKLARLLKRRFIQQQVDAFARRQFTGLAFAFPAFRASTSFGLGVAPRKLF